jgi:two-component system response regulator MprA
MTLPAISAETLLDPPTGPRRRILVVEDTASVRRLLVDVLGFDEFDVTAAPDGLAALAAYPAVRPDLVLTDVEMPGLDGLGLTRELRGRGDTVPVVVVTGRDDPDTRRAAAAAGADAFLAKPFGLVELRDCVWGLVDARAH